MSEAVTAEGAGEEFALPAKSTNAMFQVNLDSTPAAIAISFEVSIDKINWFPVLSIDQTDFVSDVFVGMPAVQPIPGQFVRQNVTSNTDEAEVTSIILCKPIGF